MMWDTPPRRRPVHRILQRVQVQTLDQLHSVASLRPWWVFRGQSSWKWRLEPSLERNRQQTEWQSIEDAELSNAKEAAYNTSELKDSDHLAWLAKLRHDGRPVRLLDFTTDLAVALHFATRERSRDTPVIWAVDGMRLEVAWRVFAHASDPVLNIRGASANCEEFNRIFEKREGVGAAMFVEPRAPNPRREAQKGLFLVGLNLNRSLEQNLFGCLGYAPTEVNPAIGERGLPTGPVGFFTMPLSEHARENLADALIVQIWLNIDEAEIRTFLAKRGISDSSLGL